jgi:DNA-binding response OmpR family regulator
MHYNVRVPIELAERARRQPTIMVLSDDQDWREAVQRVLEQEGYEVLSVRHAGHALVEWMRHEGAIDLLLADGTHVRRLSDLTARMMKEDSRMRWLSLGRRPSSREDLLTAVATALATPTFSDRIPRA